MIITNLCLYFNTTFFYEVIIIFESLVDCVILDIGVMALNIAFKIFISRQCNHLRKHLKQFNSKSQLMIVGVMYL